MAEETVGKAMEVVGLKDQEWLWNSGAAKALSQARYISVGLPELRDE